MAGGAAAQRVLCVSVVGSVSLPCSDQSSVNSCACFTATPSRSNSASRVFHFSTSFNAWRLRHSARASTRSACALCRVWGSEPAAMCLIGDSPSAWPPVFPSVVRYRRPTSNDDVEFVLLLHPGIIGASFRPESFGSRPRSAGATGAEGSLEAELAGTILKYCGVEEVVLFWFLHFVSSRLATTHT